MLEAHSSATSSRPWRWLGITVASLGLVVCVLLATPCAAAQVGSGTEGSGAAEIDRRASSIARQTMSPFCPGRTLADCPSQYAAEWRDDIHAMVAEGKQADEIQAILSERAGRDLSGIPNRDTGYALPILFAVLATGVLGFVLLRLRQPRDPAGVQSGTDSATAEKALDARLNEELAAEDDD